MFTATDNRRTYDARAEWGPAKNDPDHPLHRHHADGLDAVALRDGDDARPDDN